MVGEESFSQDLSRVQEVEGERSVGPLNPGYPLLPELHPDSFRFLSRLAFARDLILVPAEAQLSRKAGCA